MTFMHSSSVFRSSSCTRVAELPLCSSSFWVRWMSPGWKTRILVLSRYGKTVYPTFESGGGTADHLTGSLLSNWCVLESMLCPDFFSDLSFSRYKLLEWIWRNGLFCTMWLSELKTSAIFWDLRIYSMIETDILWYDLREYMCYF